MLSKVFIRLLESTDKPEHPIEFICENLGPTRKESVQIESLRQEVADYRNQVESLKKQLEEVTALNRLATVAAAESSPSIMKIDIVDNVVATTTMTDDLLLSTKTNDAVAAVVVAVAPIDESSDIAVALVAPSVSPVVVATDAAVVIATAASVDAIGAKTDDAAAIKETVVIGGVTNEPKKTENEQQQPDVVKTPSAEKEVVENVADPVKVDSAAAEPKSGDGVAVVVAANDASASVTTN